LGTLGVIAWELVSATLWFAGCFPLWLRVLVIGFYAVSYVPLYPPFFWRERVKWAAARGCRDVRHRFTKRFDETGEVKLGGTVDFIACGQVWRAQYRPAWKRRGIWHAPIGNVDQLARCLRDFRSLPEPFKKSAAKWITAQVHTAGEAGCLHNFNLLAPVEVRRWMMPVFLFTGKEGWGLPAADLDRSNFQTGFMVYGVSDDLMTEKDFKAKAADIETFWGEPVVIETLTDPKTGKPIAGFIVVRSYPVLPDVVDLAEVKYDVNLFELGVSLTHAEPIGIYYQEFLHMMIQGIPGNGKSWIIRCIAKQAEDHPAALEIKIADLKGGVDYAEFMDRPKFSVLGKLKEVEDLFADAVKEMERRLEWMRAYNETHDEKIDMWTRWVVDEQHPEGHWVGGDTWIFIDEFAYLVRRNAVKLLANICDLAQRGRAAGFRLCFATQKATADAIPKEISICLQLKICFCVEQLIIARQMFGDTGGLLADPTKLAIGTFLTFVHAHQKHYLLRGYRAC
jgi:hypothetical protein